MDEFEPDLGHGDTFDETSATNATNDGMWIIIMLALLLTVVMMVMAWLMGWLK